MPTPLKEPGKRLGHSMGKYDSSRDRKTVPIRPVKVPPTDKNWHPYVQGWFNALKMSGMSKFFVETDWAMALLGAEILDELYQRGFATNGSATAMNQFNEISKRLLCCIGDRRAARIELIRKGLDPDDQDIDEAEASAAMNAWRDKFNGNGKAKAS